MRGSPADFYRRRPGLLLLVLSRLWILKLRVAYPVPSLLVAVVLDCDAALAVDKHCRQTEICRIHSALPTMPILMCLWTSVLPLVWLLASRIFQGRQQSFGWQRQMRMAVVLMAIPPLNRYSPAFSESFLV